MTQAQRYKYSLQLPQSLEDTAMETASDFLMARAGTAKPGDLTRLLDRAPDTPPMSKDAIDD